MKRIVLSFASLLCATLGFAQETSTQEEGPKDGWTRQGNVSLLFNQSAFNNEWQGGGTSNIAGNLSLSYDFNYRKGSITWDNKILADYGLTKLKGEDFTSKTNDRLEFNSLLGKQLQDSNWYVSFFANFKTQFDSGFVNNDDGTRTKTTHFFSPAYLQFGPGMLWKKSDNLKVNIAPATAKFVFVHDEFTRVDTTDPLAVAAYVPYFGVDANETSRFEFGASLSGYAKFDLMKNVSMENTLNLYSNYLEDPQNIDVDYTANIVMSINKYLSANIIFQAIYDDNAVKAWQIREVFGLGINYGF